jgi:hypothetical protein
MHTTFLFENGTSITPVEISAGSLIIRYKILSLLFSLLSVVFLYIPTWVKKGSVCNSGLLDTYKFDTLSRHKSASICVCVLRMCLKCYFCGGHLLDKTFSTSVAQVKVKQSRVQ